MSDEFRTLNLNDESKADLHIPVTCPKCGHRFKYTGLGEYTCEECKFIAYDDYGKVRNYIEAHPGASVTEVEMETGVKKIAIRRLLNEERLDLKPYSTVQSDNIFK